MPSRRFYIAGRAEFHNLRRTKGKALSLSRRRKVRLEEDEEDEDEPNLGRIAQDLQMVSSSIIVMLLFGLVSANIYTPVWFCNHRL